ncbi:protein-L-isoaspartate(D-aspartate) O-methyltransferase [Halobacteriaceae archaeon SHR40]|uniref:protein-L-isoaspartate(D-aspartate) O-methyltransferase n=1 Tax=Halovenus amylolytica TaxID=2500550 RepID=UPI000FE410B9
MDFDKKRDQLVERLETHRNLGDRTLDAIREVPRHEFVPASKRSAAYNDAPLPIGEGQTISAPHMVAIMAELLELKAGDEVLEIGTGCGYHAAVTAELVGPEHVYSVEYHSSLAERARETLQRTGYGEVSVRTGDGREGWSECAPYDRSYLTCAADTFPESLREQVRTGGIILGPLRDGGQRLVKGVVQSDGTLERETHGRVRFVPLK